MPQSVWIELKDPEEYLGVTSAVKGLDGVSDVRDARDKLEPIYGTINALQSARSARPASSWSPRCSSSPTPSAWLRSPVAARSASCGWSGASTLYIALPFLMEALVTAVLGVGLAAGALWRS